MEEVVAAYYCAMDKNTPLRAKGILLAALGYFVLPVDVIPDFIFGLGFTDDIAVLTAAITAVSAHITPAHGWPPGRRSPTRAERCTATDGKLKSQTLAAFVASKSRKGCCARRFSGGGAAMAEFSWG